MDFFVTYYQWRWTSCVGLCEPLLQINTSFMTGKQFACIQLMGEELEESFISGLSAGPTNQIKFKGYKVKTTE